MPKKPDLGEELDKLYAGLDDEEALLIAREVIDEALFEIRTGRRNHSNMSELIVSALEAIQAKESPKKCKERKRACRPDFNYQTGKVISDRLRSERAPESEKG